VFKDMTKWRPVVIFGFGLIHGLGLQRMLRDPAGIAGYRSYVVRPGSALIGLTGFWWGITRLIG
jgi:hypothetical protein